MRWLIGITALIIVLLVGWIAYPFISPPKPPGTETAVVVNKALNRLYYYKDGKYQKYYDVATGREPELTPEGDFQIITKTADDDGLGAEGVFGTRWMGLEVPGDEDGLRYGIHGTNEPESIGSHATAGCIRMGKVDLEELYQQVSIGTQVRIISGSLMHRFIRKTMPSFIM